MTTLYPVPDAPPDEGQQHICSIADDWIPVLIGLMSALRDPFAWIDPPSDITAQVDEFINQIVKDYVPVVAYVTNYTHFHFNSTVVAGNAISALINTSHELATLWRQNTAAQNDESYFDVWLDVGDYDFDVCFAKNSTSGKLTLLIVGEPFTGWVLDLYNAATQINQHSVLPFSVTVAGRKRVSLKVATKNASSGGYVCNISYISIKKTG